MGIMGIMAESVALPNESDVDTIIARLRVSGISVCLVHVDETRNVKYYLCNRANIEVDLFLDQESHELCVWFSINFKALLHRGRYKQLFVDVMRIINCVKEGKRGGG